MGWLLVGSLLLIGALLLAHWYVNVDPRQLAKVVRVVGATLLGLLALRFLMMGNLAIVGPLVAGILMLMGRWPRRGVPGFGFPGWGRGAAQDPSPGRVSTVETEFLRMTLDHDSGMLEGDILKGRYSGQGLSRLSLEALLDLLAECRREDPEAGALLESYLDRVHGGDWRLKDGPAGEEGRTEKAETGSMTRDQALAVLGLQPGASDGDVVSAHRQLMKKLHPDHGGTTYLASKINQAKDFLLGE